MKAFALATLYLLAAATFFPVRGQSQASFLQTLGRAEGLPSSQVHSIVEGPRGHLWMATPAGIARYDGARVTALDHRDGLLTQGTRALAADGQGRIWVGGDQGIDLVAPEAPIRPLSADWQWGFVDAIAIDGDGVAWIATNSGLLRWSESHGILPVRGGALLGSTATATAIAGGRVWVTTDRALAWVNAEGELAPFEHSILEDLAPLRALHPTESGLYIGGDHGLALLSFLEEKVARLLGPERSAVTAITEQGSELWVAASNTVTMYRRTADGSLTSPSTVAENTVVNEFFEDRFGNLWIATDGSGVARISALRVALGQAPMPCETQVFSIVPWQDSYLIGGESCSWVAGRDLQPADRLAELDQVKVWDLLRDRSGRFWVAAQTGLLRAADTSDKPPLVRSDFGLEVLRAPSRALLETNTSLYVATVGGLARVQGEEATEVLDPNGESFGYVYTLEHSEEGLWIGTIGRGLFLLDPQGVVTRPIPSIERGNVYDVALGPQQAVAVLHDDKITVREDLGLTSIEPLTGDAIAGWSARFVGPEVLWVGSLSGLIRYDLNAGQHRRYTARAGLRGDEFTTSRSLLVTSGGRVLQGTDGGLSWLDYPAINELLPEPTIQLSALRWPNAQVLTAQPALSEAPARVREGRWNLEFEIAVPWFVEPDGLEFRYRIPGLDPGWSPRRPVRANLSTISAPPGSFVLEAQAYSPLVGYGPVVELTRFTVVRHWWNTLAARLAALLSLAAAVAALASWRNAALTRRARRLESLVQERTRELEQLAGHDQLTGLPNRRSFHEQADRLIAEGRRRQRPFSLVILDLNRFKQLNDRLGHQAGDRALREVSGVLSKAKRVEDLAARYGGDEFVILCPETETEQALGIARRVRAALEERGILAHRDPTGPTVTASFGVATWQQGEKLDDLFRRADAALYRAKQDSTGVCGWTEGLADLELGSGGWRQKNQPKTTGKGGF